ncbi:MAG: Spi family protease inhibitor [Prevotella sp.]|nr:Spi family protease inhibitor [Prevotella sp.]
MKKILLLSVIAFFSCNNEEIYNEKENVSQNLPEEKFNVTQSDIEKVVTDYFYSTQTRAKGNSYEIAEINAISNNANSTTRATNDNPHNLLYIVRMSDGSTVIVGGDKRAEPVYAHFDNLNLKIFLFGC